MAARSNFVFLVRNFLPRCNLSSYGLVYSYNLLSTMLSLFPQKFAGMICLPNQDMVTSKSTCALLSSPDFSLSKDDSKSFHSCSTIAIDMNYTSLDSFVTLSILFHDLFTEIRNVYFILYVSQVHMVNQRLK